MAKKKLKVLLVFGTRPEVIKMAPVVKELRHRREDFVVKVCVTGQHRQMIDPLLKLFAIKSDYDLNIMTANQNLEHITSNVLQKVGSIIQVENPDYLLVQGDTTTAMAASLAAFYQKVKVGHIESGLRTFNKFHPYPEEVNRRIIDSVSDLFFAHTAMAKQNLLREGFEARSIEITGNTVIDALLETARKPFSFVGTSLEHVVDRKEKIILVTAHRRENMGEPIINICRALKEVALKYKNQLTFVYPVHLNPNIKEPVHSILRGVRNIVLTEPLEYLPFVHLMKRSYFIITDSGGLQEEAPSLGKPVLVLRETTERPEGVAAGCVDVIGTQKARIVKKIVELLENKKKYLAMSKARNPYGDGRAAVKTANRLLKGNVTKS
jgi:UDP-N-acetylglucosamine 2-epimerase (non-hydrolysing)